MSLKVKEKKLLDEAREHIFSLSCQDASAQVSELNTCVGIGKMISVLKNMGCDVSRLVAVFTPDGGITRNKDRWQYGFGYGCWIRWPSPEEIGFELCFPQVKPNACGVLVIKLLIAPSAREIYQRLQLIKEKGFFLQDMALKFNLGVSNHFIEVYRVRSSFHPRLNPNELVAVIHTSPSELKKELADWSSWEEKGGKWKETSLGKIFVLTGKTASSYFQRYQEIENFGRQKRLSIAKALFGPFEVITNPTHQGMSAINAVRLGLYDSTDSLTCAWDEPIFPLTLRWDLPVFLIRGKPNLSLEVLEESGLSLQAKQQGMVDLLLSTNILPHGGGYSIPFSPQRLHLKQENDRYFFHLQKKNSEYIFSNPAELPYNYRGTEVLEKIQSLQLGEVIAELKQLYTIKY